jgi:hypothetical protein
MTGANDLPLLPDADPVLAAVILQLAELQGRVMELAASSAADNAEIQVALRALRVDLDAVADRVRELAGEGEGPPGLYRPVPAPRWWELPADQREPYIAWIRWWVDHVFRPGYGFLAAELGECWEQHDLALYVLDWLSELWRVHYIPERRSARDLGSVAEWYVRLLTNAAEILARETGRCGHDQDGPFGEAWTDPDGAPGAWANGGQPR